MSQKRCTNIANTLQTLCTYTRCLMSHWFPIGPYETHCFVCSLSGLRCHPKARRKTNGLCSTRERRKTNIARRGCHTQTLAAKHPSPAPSDPQPLQNVLQRLQTVTRQNHINPTTAPESRQQQQRGRREGDGKKTSNKQTTKYESNQNNTQL